MAQITVKYVQAFVDRHGKVRHYFRKQGSPRVALPGLPGSTEFMDAYKLALSGASSHSSPTSKLKSGTISALIASYYLSSDFTQLKRITQSSYRNVMERFRAEHGDKSVAGIETKHIRSLLDDLAQKPGAAKSLRRALGILMRFAVERGWRKDNPTLSLRRMKRKTEGFRAWTEDDIAAFEAFWPQGTRARLALSLLLYTAQRRSDVVVMGRQHMQGGYLQVTQSKTDTRLQIPLHPRLVEAISYAPKDHLTFLVTAYGKPMTPAGFTNWFADCAKAAGLPPRSSPHGLRKAAARRLAEAGRSGHQIMAVTGHKALSEVTTYTSSANQAMLAKAAFDTDGGV